jgi:hypothetical protein
MCGVVEVLGTDVEQKDYNGPFILWAVDEPEIEDDEESDD